MSNNYLHLCPLANYGLTYTDIHETHKCPTALHSDLLSGILLKLDIKYTGCPMRNALDFGRVFLMLKYTDITQNNYTQS